MHKFNMYRYNLIVKLGILRFKPVNSLKNVRFSSMSFYEVKGPKHTSKHDYTGEIDSCSVDKPDNIVKTDTVMGFLKSPEYQLLKATTPTPTAILNSFYNYSPPIKCESLGDFKLYRWGNVELSGYHKLTDFLWYLGVNNVIDKQEIEKFSHNFSIAELSVDDAVRMLLVFEGLNGPLNVCSLAMYEHLFHDKPVTTQQLLSLAFALGKVRHSIDTLTLPLVSILHKKPLKLDERIKLFLAVSRLEPTINLIEFYTFSTKKLSDDCNESDLLFQVINMDRWEEDIRKDGYVDQYNLTDYPVSLTCLQILQLINGLSNISLEWIIGSVHKRIELKRLWKSNLGEEIIYRDQMFSYRTPLVAFCKMLLSNLNKMEFNIVGFYVVERNLINLPIHGVSLAHVLNVIDEVGNLEAENSHFCNISATTHQLIPSCISDITEFIKILKHKYTTVVTILESFVTNMERKYDISQSDYVDTEYYNIKQNTNKNLNDLSEIIRKMGESNKDLKDKLTKSFEKIKYISQKVNLD